MFPMINLMHLVSQANGYINRLSIRNAELMKDRKSGYLCIARRRDGRILLIVQVGECLSEKADLYRELCQEKAERLAEYPDHISAYQSHDMDLEKYPGAVVAGDYIIAFSGLPWKADEALSLHIGISHGLLEQDQATEIANISSNELFLPVLVP